MLFCDQVLFSAEDSLNAPVLFTDQVLLTAVCNVLFVVSVHGLSDDVSNVLFIASLHVLFDEVSNVLFMASLDVFFDDDSNVLFIVPVQVLDVISTVLFIGSVHV